MRLYTNCHNCKKEIRFSSWESDRVELSKSKGDKIELTCKNCVQKDLYHINRIKATESKVAQIIGLIIFLVGTPLVFIWIWDYIFQFAYIYVIAGLVGMIGVPFMIYSVIEREQRKKVRQFNNYKISE
jgi:hypothetical protein